MYNRQLDTFIRVADAGSFSKAAEESHITPTAVIKQINSLEAELGLHLFERTHRGLKLTDGGESLYKDAKYIIQYCRDSVQRANEAVKQRDIVVRIGTSPMTPGEFLLSLWPKIQEYCPDIMFRLVPFDNTPENAREILRNLGENIDIVAGFFDGTCEEAWGCAALKLRDEPISCAVSIHHGLAAQKSLTVGDLRGEKLMLIRRGWNTYVDSLRDYAAKESLEIIDFDFFNLNVFNRCENSNDVLMAFDSWKNAHPLMKILPVEWEFSVPYGLLYAPKPTETVKRFLKAVETALGL
jgi:DNA-binding transcriptional LysR family regulator